MIDVRQLDYSIQDTHILKNLNLSVPAGCVFHIQAENGAGKTTLLQLLSGLKKPDGGFIFFNNQSIHKQLKWFQKKINYLGHQTPLQNQLTIAENWLLSNVSSEVYNKGINYFELNQCQHKLVRQLSEGQRKKAVLMSFLFDFRPIWILDEPFVGLDEVSVSKFMYLVVQHVASNGLVVLTSHQSLPPISAKVKEFNL